jgi:hypothetical protein
VNHCLRTSPNRRRHQFRARRVFDDVASRDPRTNRRRPLAQGRRNVRVLRIILRNEFAMPAVQRVLRTSTNSRRNRVLVRVWMWGILPTQSERKKRHLAINEMSEWQTVDATPLKKLPRGGRRSRRQGPDQMKLDS